MRNKGKTLNQDEQARLKLARVVVVVVCVCVCVCDGCVIRALSKPDLCVFLGKVSHFNSRQFESNKSSDIDHTCNTHETECVRENSNIQIRAT